MTATIDPLLLAGPAVRQATRPIVRSVPSGRASQAPASRPRAAAGRSTLATYRRRRMGVVAAAVFALASLLLASGAFATQPSPKNLQSIPRSYVVQSGDTLWSIARTYMPTGNISGFVDELARMNGVDLEVGQIVRIP